MYYKLALAVAYFISGWLVLLILRRAGFSEKNSRLGAFIWFTSPVAIYSTYIFGQYDILTLVFVLAGVYFYIKNNNPLFIFFRDRIDLQVLFVTNFLSSFIVEGKKNRRPNKIFILLFSSGVDRYLAIPAIKCFS